MERLEKGIYYDQRTRVARVEVTSPGTKSKKRWRRTFTNVPSPVRALKLAEEFRAEITSGKIDLPKTFTQFLDRCQRDVTTGIRDKTKASYEGHIRNHIAPYFGPMHLTAINLATIKRFYVRLTNHKKKANGKRLSPYSINGTLRVLRVLLKHACAVGIIEKFPEGKWPHEHEPQVDAALDAEEVERFLSAFDDEAAFRALIQKRAKKGAAAESEHYRGLRIFGGTLRSDSDATGEYYRRFRWWKPLFVVAVDTGIRKSDVLGLTWDDVKFSGRGTVRKVMHKTRKEVAVPMTSLCREMLKECLTRQVVGERCFLHEDGRPATWEMVRGYFVIAKEIAGLTRRVRFHDLRHAFGALLADAGLNLPQIAKALGHTETRTTERYANPTDEAHQQVVYAAVEARRLPSRRMVGR